MILKQCEAVAFDMPSLDNEMCRESLQRKAEEIQRIAYEEGFASGEKAGLSHGEQKALILIEKLENVLKEIVEFRENLVLNLEPQVVDLSVTIAKKIIIEEVGTRPEIIVTMVREALKRLQRIGTLTIKINPSLYELFSKKRPELLEMHSDIVFDVNSNVAVTGPLVISDIEEVVTDIDSLIDNIVAELKAENREGSTE